MKPLIIQASSESPESAGESRAYTSAVCARHDRRPKACSFDHAMGDRRHSSCCWRRLASAQDAASKADKSDWIQLFNGKNLDGWTVKIAKHKVGDNFGRHVSRPGRPAESFVRQVHHARRPVRPSLLQRQVFLLPGRGGVSLRRRASQGRRRTGAYRNNGIMVHSQSAESMGFDQDFPTSIEVQLLGGDGTHDRPNGNVCTPGTNIVIDGALYTPHCYEHFVAKTYHGDQWVRVVAEVLGSERITHYVEGTRS